MFILCSSLDLLGFFSICRALEIFFSLNKEIFSLFGDAAFFICDIYFSQFFGSGYFGTDTLKMKNKKCSLLL